MIYKLKVGKNKLEVDYDCDWETIRDKFENQYTEFNPQSNYLKNVPRFVSKTYKFYYKHDPKKKKLYFKLGWIFYFGTVLKDQLKNVNELEKVKNK